MKAQWRSGLVAVVLAAMLTSLSMAADVKGSYSCKGTNPNGTPYAGTTVISENGGGYALRWTIGGQSHSGTAILMDGQLSASWGVPGGAYGIVVYKVEQDGRLVGKWLNPGGGDLGTETLTPE
jgi:hypothetical protein